MNVDRLVLILLVLLIVTLPLTLRFLVFLKNLRRLPFPKVLLETQINYARTIINESRALLTWHKTIRLRWIDWNLGYGVINRRIEMGDVLLVKGRWNHIYILIVVGSHPEESNPNSPFKDKLNYHFHAIFSGVVWNRQTFGWSRI